MVNYIIPFSILASLWPVHSSNFVPSNVVFRVKIVLSWERSFGPKSKMKEQAGRKLRPSPWKGSLRILWCIAATREKCISKLLFLKTRFRNHFQRFKHTCFKFRSNAKNSERREELFGGVMYEHQLKFSRKIFARITWGKFLIFQRKTLRVISTGCPTQTFPLWLRCAHVFLPNLLEAKEAKKGVVLPPPSRAIRIFNKSYFIGGFFPLGANNPFWPWTYVTRPDWCKKKHMRWKNHQFESDVIRINELLRAIEEPTYERFFLCV